ncbi:hypothetical protein GGR53DRAFT_202711 [Hypoxylon sp. FL1150]|nr:hypothetical protein GGR53DRAFT_202711 [Hypoxylon sp. FL1150]
MPPAPRLRAACDICHNLKVRCSGTMPCEACAESGASCFYSVSNRLGRPPGAKNKRSASTAEARSSSSASDSSIPPSSRTPTMIVPPPQLMIFPEDSTGDRTTMGQSRWPLNRPTPRRLQSDSQTRRSRQRAERLLTSPIASGEGNMDSSKVDPKTNDNTMESGGDMRDLNVSGRIEWDTGVYGLSGLLGGHWNWNARPLESSSVESRDSSYDEMTLDEATGFSAMPHRTGLNDMQALPTDPTPQMITAELLDVLAAESGPGPFYPAQPEPSPTEECSCLRYHTELLCALKSSTSGSVRSSPKADGSGSGYSPLGNIMTTIQEAFKTWRKFIHCPNCAQNGDQEVLLLSLMCARSVLTQLEGVTWIGGGNNTPDDTGPTLTLGEFRVEGDEKSTLLHALRSLTLRKIEAVLIRLKEVLERIKRLESGLEASRLPENRRGRGAEGPRLESRGGDGMCNLAYAEQMLQGLMRYVRVLEGGFASNQMNI